MENAPKSPSYIKVSALVVASMKQVFVHRPESTAELARLALDLLVKERGTEGARLFLREEFSTYRRDYRGFHLDRREPKTGSEPMTGPSQSAYKVSPPIN
ncbi:hypothetical protein [Pseudomonas sp. PS02288]|uniref:hypothetical protein n=1 Tax=Pseudomonas sp. PS02288 TaxID=2991443 RepID=UPI00249A485C|nr:hypothetical protein [Pseudomonas sp. PS02288]